MKQEKKGDLSTLILRCWSEKDAQGNVITWRFTLEDVATNQRSGFAGIAALLTFLQHSFIESGNPENNAAIIDHT